jgi:hypothetical protein
LQNSILKMRNIIKQASLWFLVLEQIFLKLRG